MKEELPFSSSLKDSKLVFRGTWFDVRTLGKRDVVIHPGAVVILPLLDDEHILMIKNERFAVGETLWELPAGTLEPREHPDATASRELVEETGYEAKKIEPLTTFYTSPGICNERMFAYTAQDLIYVGQKLDETEKITVEVVEWKKIREMIFNGEIHDGKTLTTLLFYLYFSQKEI